MVAALTAEERAVALDALPEWRYDAARRALHRRVRLASFADALALMVRIGIEVEKANHHPDWRNLYDRLDIWLTTHDCGGVSQRDIDLAGRIDALVFTGYSCEKAQSTGR